MRDEVGNIESVSETAQSVSAIKTGLDSEDGTRRKTMSWVNDLDEEEEHLEWKRKELVGAFPSPLSKERSVVVLASEGRYASGRTKSPSSSTSTKRPSNHGTDALSTTLRTKIREQAKSKLKRKRGNLQLTKRLQRTEAYEEEDDPSNEIDQDQLDADIERSLKLGSKYVASVSDGRLPSENVQYDFLTATYEEHEFEDEAARRNGETSMVFAKPKPQSKTDEGELWKLQMTYEKKSPVRTDGENGMQRTRNNFLYPEVAYDFSRLKQRLGHDLVDSHGDLLGSSSFLIEKPLKVQQDDEQRPVCTYVKAEDWKMSSKGLKREQFMQLDIDINRVVFEHHWLFSKEDMICSVIHNLHATQTQRAKEALSFLREIIAEKQRIHRDDLATIHSQTAGDENIAELITALKEKQRDYIRLGQLIEENWHRLQLIRCEQGFSSSALTVQKSVTSSQDVVDMKLSSLSEHLQEFTRIPVYALSDNGGISEHRPREELDRVAFISKCHIQLLIHFNDILVCSTKFHPMDGNFVAFFGQIYNLQIHEPPQSITVTVIEKAPGLDARKLAKVGLPLPDEDRITRMNAPLEVVQFGSDLFVDRVFSAVGSGGQLPCISGKLFCNVTWAQRGLQTCNSGDSRGLFKQQQHKADHFLLIPRIVHLCIDEEFDDDLRLEVLKQRSEHKLVNNKNTQRICLIADEIDPQILTSNEQKVGDRFRLNTSIDLHLIAGMKYAAMIRSQIRERLSSEQQTKSLYDVVQEEPIPTVCGALGAFVGPMDASRKLKPMRRAAIRQQVTSGIDYRIMINVQSAVNLPERIAGGLQPFVEFAFQGFTAMTTAVSGRNPNWQQSIGMKINGMEDVENDVELISDSLQLIVYDQMVTKLQSDDREPNAVHEQLGKHFIGRVHIPFLTIYCNARIDAYLRIETPLFSSLYKNSEKPSYIKVVIAIDPAIIPLRIPSTIPAASNESEQLLRKCDQWKNVCRSQFPERRFVSLVSDANGRQVLACRYIRGIKPPSCVESSSAERTLEVACRIVSYVPFIADPNAFPDLRDVLTSADQFLAIGCGNEEEHAVLLCCWLLHLNITAYLLLGSALREGPSAAYVLAFIDTKMMILNPTDGHCYTSDDPMCPLVSVGTAISGLNVYANIQSHEHPSQMHFDFKKNTHWRALFEKDKGDIQSVQPELINYANISDDNVMQLRCGLEREIKARFDESRPYGIPQWNLLACRMLREVLGELESPSASCANVDARLAQLRNSYNMNALAIRERYVSVERLVEVVMRTNIHVNSEHTTQFALAVHIQPYMNNVISCCVAIAALMPVKS
uniref:Coiled-coil and C2 domain-containing protein 2A n=1 Tax=Ascaris suum TaxID=6253 RepID=F1KQY7_ASCSU